MTFARPFPMVFRPAMSGFHANGLLNGLVSYWKLDSDLLDSIGGNNLTATGGPSYVAGKIGNAVDLDGSTQYKFVADNAALSGGDTDFSVGWWVNLDTLTGVAARTLCGKFTATGNQREYWLMYNRTDHAPNDRFSFVVSATGTTTVGTVDATTFGVVSTGAWYLVVGWHDSVNNQIGVSINSVPDVAAHTTGVFDGTSAFAVGARANVLASLLDGKLDEGFFYRRVLSALDINRLYNNGNGLPLSEYTY